jgi:prepilin-type N-terminal cleavage/methylation domain-containing protein
MDHPHSSPTAGDHAGSRVSRARAGFTLIELMVVVGLIGVMSAVAIMVAPSALRSAKADSGGARVMSALRTAREQAIAQRRNVRVDFTAPNVVTATRVEVPGPATTVLGTTTLEDGVRFLLFAGVPDTPDAFGNGTAMAFGTATSYFFTSEGTFVDQNGDAVNGTVFLGRVNDPLSARAVSLFGPTALIRLWRWDGRQWTN